MTESASASSPESGSAAGPRFGGDGPCGEVRRPDGGLGGASSSESESWIMIGLSISLDIACSFEVLSLNVSTISLSNSDGT